MRKKRFDCHHILWPASEYSTGYKKTLRNYWYLRCWIPKDTLHHEIHNLIAGIPVPTDANCKCVYECLLSLEASGVIKKNQKLVTRLTILACLFRGLEPQTAKALKDVIKVVNEVERS